MRLPSRFRELGVAALVVIALAGASASDAAVDTPRILLVSKRDGSTRGYSVGPDGSRLTPLLPRARALVPAALSGDGGTIAYNDKAGVYVSRANGTRLRLLVRAPAVAAALSRDGKMLAFTRSRPGIWIAGTDRRGFRRLTSGPDSSPAWSPDGNAIVFLTELGDDHEAIVVKALGGSRKVIGRDGGPVDGLAWSPDGRWIGYLPWGDDDEDEFNLWLVRPSGEDRHLVARDVDTYSWSRDGKWLALTYGLSGKMAVIGADGRSRTLGFRGLDTSALSWAPDGRRLALAGAGQIWVVGRDGRGLRRVTSRGANSLVGWTRLPSVLPPARPVPPTERVTGSHTLALRTGILSSAADEGRIAFLTGVTPTDCNHFAVWTASRRFVTRVSGFPAPCSADGHEYADALGPVALAGRMVAWRSRGRTGNTEETHVTTTMLGRSAQPSPSFDAGRTRGGGAGTLFGRPVGDGGVLAFAERHGCDPSDDATEDPCPPGRGEGSIVRTIVYRIGGPGPCPLAPFARPAPCSVVTEADGVARLLAVDAGRVAVATATGVEVLTVGGRLLREFDVAAERAAALSGNRLALETFQGIAVYDLRTGRRTARLPLSDLQDLEGDVLVVAPVGSVRVRDVRTGRTVAFRTRGTPRAQLERPGLFVAGGRRITFTPMADLRRRLGSSA